jgi:GNAT superfamily N-acetyltransferase
MRDDEAVRRDSRQADEAEAAAFRDMCSAAPAEFRRATGLRTTEAGGATLVVAPGIPATMFNRAIGLGVSHDAAEADVGAVIDEFRAAGSTSFWIHVNPSARPAMLESWLVARGFKLARRRAWAKMLFDGPEAPTAGTSLTVREVGAPHADELAKVLVTAFEMPLFFASWFRELVGRPGWHAVGAFDGTRLVCGGFVYHEREFAWLGIGGTLPEFRGRGGQRAIMARRMQVALSHGARRIVTETGEQIGDEPNVSLANMRRSGFRQVSSRLNYEPG